MTTAIGTQGIVVCDGESGMRRLSITNNNGGTTFLPEGRYLVELVYGFEDEETGTVRHGRLLREEDIQVARKVGTCEYDSEYWRKRVEGPDAKPHDRDHLRRVLEAEKNFDPSYVYFHVWSSNPNWFPGETE